MYYTYVLLCKSNSKSVFYFGSSSDLKTRIKAHKEKSVKTTKKYDIIELVYYEACLNKADAIKRELQLKTGFGRGYINKRIASYLKARA